MSTSPAFISAPKSPAVQIVNGTGTAYVSLMVAGANGARVDAGFITNSDSGNAYVASLAIRIGATDFPIGEVPVAAGAGTNGTTKAVSLLNETDLPGLVNTDGVLYLGASCELRVKAKTLVSGANVLTFVATGGDY